MQPHAVVVVASLCMWLSAMVPLVCCRFLETLPCRRGAAENYSCVDFFVVAYSCNIMLFSNYVLFILHLFLSIFCLYVC
jgi:hypothetical protein